MNADSNDRNSYSKPDECVSFMRMKEAHMLTAQRKAGYNTLVGTENKFVIGHDDFPESVDFKNVRESSLKCYEQVGKFYIAQTARLGTSHFTIPCSKMERAEQIVSKFCTKYPDLTLSCVRQFHHGRRALAYSGRQDFIFMTTV